MLTEANETPKDGYYMISLHVESKKKDRGFPGGPVI